MDPKLAPPDWLAGLAGGGPSEEFGWAIDWCKKEITSRYPNFSFRHADVFSGQYYPEGRVPPTDYEFPFGDDRFDVVCATSLFTHMLQDGVEQYVSETARVLRPNGRALMTLSVGR